MADRAKSGSGKPKVRGRRKKKKKPRQSKTTEDGEKKKLAVDPNSMFATSNIGRYKLVRLLGKGVSGMVYEAEKGQVSYAVKRINLQGVSKADRTEMEQEVNLLKKLKHANIVQYIETLSSGSSFNIVLEFVDGGTLTDQLTNFSARPEPLIAYYTLQVLAGLTYLHNNGVIHRDIKGVNILSNRDGVVKLADFGVAKRWKASKTHSVVGTPFWMAPEIIQMNAKESPACDIWSLGCTVIELLTGHPPFFGMNPMAALYKMVAVTKPPIGAGYSEACMDFLGRCFQQDVAERATAAELLQHPWVVNSEREGEDLARASVIVQQQKWREANRRKEESRAKRQKKNETKKDKVDNTLRIDIDDMVDMEHLSADLVTSNLASRFKRNAIYTNISSILIALNPYQRVDHLYDAATLQEYHYTKPAPVHRRPHIFQVAKAAYANAVSVDVAPGTTRHQAILISGESGAGKTETTKLILRYITAMSKPKTKDSVFAGGFTIEEKLMQANPILEAFGNAKTQRNDNSSRFGRWISVMLSPEDQTSIEGASITKYLLEESRVCSPPTPGERNYNIFYQVCANWVSKDGCEEYQPTNFRYLIHPSVKDDAEQAKIAGVNDNIEFQRVVQAMYCLGFQEDERTMVFDIIRAVLQLGNVEFAAGESGDQHSSVAPDSVAVVQTVAGLLGLPEEALLSALCVKVRVSGRNSIIRSPRTVAQSYELRDSISKSLYGRLFTWIIWRINKATYSKTQTSSGATGVNRVQAPKDMYSLVKKARRKSIASAPKGAGPRMLPPNIAAKLAASSPAPAAPKAPVAQPKPKVRLPQATIGILDIFGFEVFEVNSFEQLCINYANEQLQQYFITHIFKMEQAAYTQESLDIDMISFDDNKLCVDLLGAKPSGVFSLLADELSIPGGSDTSLLEKIKHTHRKHPFFGNDKKQGNSFVIRHFPEAVEYTIDGFLDKNRSNTGEDVADVLQLSTEPIIKLLYSQYYEMLGGRNPHRVTEALEEEKKQKEKKQKEESSSQEAKKKWGAAGDKIVGAKRKARGAKPMSVGAKFQDSLKSLIASLSAANPHFVRCIKPNAIKANAQDGEKGFDQKLVLTQLRTSGMVDSVNIRKKGYPERMKHEVFVNRYHVLYGTADKKEILEHASKEALATWPQMDVSSKIWQIGTTKVFMKDKVYEILESHRAERLSKSVVLLQRYIRGFICRRRYVRQQRTIKAIKLAIATARLSAIDEALLSATREGVNQRVIHSFWVKRANIEQTQSTRQELIDCLVVTVPSIQVRLASLSMAISRARKAQGSYTDPPSTSLMLFATEVQSTFATFQAELSRAMVLAECDQQFSDAAHTLIEDLSDKINKTVKDSQEGAVPGSLGGMSDAEVEAMRQELLRSCSEADEVEDALETLSELDKMDEDLAECMDLSPVESRHQLLTNVERLSEAIDRAREYGHRREILWKARGLERALQVQFSLVGAVDRAQRDNILAALEVVNKATLQVVKDQEEEEALEEEEDEEDRRSALPMAPLKSLTEYVNDYLKLTKVHLGELQAAEDPPSTLDYGGSDLEDCRQRLGSLLKYLAEGQSLSSELVVLVAKDLQSLSADDPALDLVHKAKLHTSTNEKLTNFPPSESLLMLVGQVQQDLEKIARDRLANGTATSESLRFAAKVGLSTEELDSASSQATALQLRETLRTAIEGKDQADMDTAIAATHAFIEAGGKDEVLDGLLEEASRTQHSETEAAGEETKDAGEEDTKESGTPEAALDASEQDSAPTPPTDSTQNVEEEQATCETDVSPVESEGEEASVEAPQTTEPVVQVEAVVSEAAATDEETGSSEEIEGESTEEVVVKEEEPTEAALPVPTEPAESTDDALVRRNALIIVDLQNDFCPPNGSLAVPEGLDTLPVINKLRRMGDFDLVVLSQDFHPQDHMSFCANHSDNPEAKLFQPLQLSDGTTQVMWPVHCVQGTPGADFHPDLDRESTDVIVRKGKKQDVDSYSAFFDNDHKTFSELEAVLRKAHVTHVYCAGLAYDFCVGSTALDSKAAGFHTFVVADGARAVAPDSLEQMVGQLTEAGVHIIQSEDVPVREKPKKFDPATEADKHHWPAKSEQSGLCRVCGQETHFTCQRCTVPVCPAPCLQAYHTR